MPFVADATPAKPGSADVVRQPQLSQLVKVAGTVGLGWDEVVDLFEATHGFPGLREHETPATVAQVDAFTKVLRELKAGAPA